MVLGEMLVNTFPMVKQRYCSSITNKNIRNYNVFIIMTEIKLIHHSYSKIL